MPRRAITLISTTSSWVSILGGQKAAIFAQVGQFYFDEVGQYYSGANTWRGFAWHCGREGNLFGRQLGRILFVKPTLPQAS
jgi:hypothetical protein